MAIKIGMVRTEDEHCACLLDLEGTLRRAPSEVDAWSGQYLEPSFLKALTRSVTSDPSRLEPMPSGPFDFDLPFRGTRSLVCVGQNFRTHANELGMKAESGKEPLVYLKPAYTLSADRAETPVPENCSSLSWEGELAVVLGSEAHLLKDTVEARESIAGYVVSNDIGDYDWTLNRGGQYVKGKSFAGFNPIGGWLSVGAAWRELFDGTSMLKTSVNGRTVQSELLANMIFSPEYLVWYVSQFMHLTAGDLINCGTPGGTAAQFGKFLGIGDEVLVEITGIGTAQVKLSASVDRSSLSGAHLRDGRENV